MIQLNVVNALSNQFPWSFLIASLRSTSFVPVACFRKVSKETLVEKETVHGIDLVVVVQVEVRRSAGCLVEPE